MVNPDSSQPANGSGPSSIPSTDLPSPNSNDTQKNESPSLPSMTREGKEGSSPHAKPDQPDMVSRENALQDPNAPHQVPSLHVRTDMYSDTTMTPSGQPDAFIRHRLSSGNLPHRTPSLRALASATSSTGSLSPGSVLSSPQLMAMGDITPLPSPIAGMSTWRLSRVESQTLLSRTPSSTSRPTSGLGLKPSDSNQMLGPTRARSRSKPYFNRDKLGDETPSRSSTEALPRHARNRSLSNYIPSGKGVNVTPRPIVASGTVSLPGSVPLSLIDSDSSDLHREQYLAAQRGITSTAGRPPTPSRSSPSDIDSDSEPVITRFSSRGTPEEVYSVRSVRTMQARKYRKLRQLGQGTFSQVSLAVRMEGKPNGPVNGLMDGTINSSQKLVAVKIVEFGPAGGADEERVEVSLKREVDILRSVNHPSLVQLKAIGSDEKRALLVLDYCPGGDLFEFAASKPKPLCPGLTRRIFAELVGAVRCLHGHFIVHRDIKLESESDFPGL